MKRIVDLETDEDFEVLREILSKVRSGNIVATMRQAVARLDGTYNYIDIQQEVCNSKAIIQISGNFFYITVQSLRRTDVRKIFTMWNTVQQRATQNFFKQEPNDYLLTIDVVRNELEKNTVYCISAVQPVFVSGDGSQDLTLVFELNNVRCAKDEVSLEEIDYEIAEREESGNEVYKFTDYSDEYDDIEDEDEFEDAADKFISTDRYTDI